MLVMLEHREDVTYVPDAQVLEIERRYPPPRHVEAPSDAEDVGLQRLKRTALETFLPEASRGTKHIKVRWVLQYAPHTAGDEPGLQQGPVETLPVKGDNCREVGEEIIERM